MDVIIIGAGPAGISAALTLHARGKETLIVSNDPLASPLAKAAVIENYPGMPSVSGAVMLKAFLDQVRQQGIGYRTGHVISVIPFGERFMVSIGSEVVDAACVILATGKAVAKPYPGEAELLGRGVSYCATCDGMLYRGRKVCVVGSSAEAVSEAAFLAQIGCEVVFVSRSIPAGLPEGIVSVQARRLEVAGDGKVEALIADDERIGCEAVFILRPTLAPDSLVSGLGIDGASIVVDAGMATNIPGMYAAGDCTGEPYQVAKAVGEGQIAAFSAVRRIDSM